MSKERESPARSALKLALEALEEYCKHGAIFMPLTTRDAIREALAQSRSDEEQPAQQECNHCGGTGDVSGEYPGVACPECNGSGVQVQPEFIKHEVEQPYDWSEWACPGPESYLMKCCDCGLVHEAQFRVAKYQPSPSDECEVVNDPDLLAQFRMRRSEQWSPKDMAYRPRGLPLAEEPAQQQEPVAVMTVLHLKDRTEIGYGSASAGYDLPTGEYKLYTSPPVSKRLTDEQIMEMYNEPRSDAEMLEFARAIEAAHGIKGDA